MASAELEWAKAVIARDRARAGVSTERYDADAARNSLPETRLPLPEGVTIRQVIANEVTCYWVCAPGSSPDRAVLYLHGGGFAAGGFHSHRGLVAWLAAASGASVLFPEYRLAPEHRFPAGLEDCFAAYRHILDVRADGSAGSPETVFIVGDSAGGALANSVLHLARARGARMADGAAILCGMMDLDDETSGFLRLTQRTRDGARLYVSHLRDLKNPLASAIEADPTGLPPLLVQTGSDDYCAEDCERFADKARTAGVPVTFENWPEMIHGWHRFAPRLPEASAALERIAAWMDEVSGGAAERMAGTG